MTYFRTINLTIALLLLATTSYAYSDYDNLSCGEYSDCSSCETNCDCGCARGFLSAELIYWRAYEDGLDICVPVEESDEIAPSGFVTSRFTGRGRDPHFRWDPGFRIGAGYGQECGWDVAAFWTRFRSDANRDSVRWNINFDVVDVTAGYNNCFCSFTLRPYIGLRGARIKQQLRIENYNSIDDITNGIHNRQRFEGLGPIIGLDGDWNIGCTGFSLYGNAAFSWLYWNNNVKLRAFESETFSQSFCRQTNHLNANLAAIDVGFGIRWNKCLFERPFVLQLGLEHHRYFDYNRFGCSGDLSFDGINLSAAIGF